MGAALHDAGKIRHPQELSEPGSFHEHAGEVLLIENGIAHATARFCVSHSRWNSPDLSLEERIVTLADKLWKGKRESELELNLIDKIATDRALSRWDIFERLDTAFERIAATGTERIGQSIT